MELLWIDSDAKLAELVQGLLTRPVLALDTEFVRTRSFYSQLGLIQIFDGEQVALIDALSIDDWQPLAHVLNQPDICKVLHACSEDLEIFYHLLGSAGQNLVDSQILAAFAGLGSSLGFAALLEQQLGHSLNKAESRSDWLKRPLSAAQIRYAAEDVYWLLPLYHKLHAEFGQSLQWQWALADSQTLADPARFVVADQRAYLRIKLAWQLKPVELQVLRALAAWREQEARQRDIARNFIVHEAALLALSRRMPQQLHELARISELSPVDIRRYGSDMLGIIAQARTEPKELWPEAVERLIDWPGYRALYAQCQNYVAQIAKDSQLNPELLASRKLIDRFIRRYRRQLDSPLSGWRHTLLDTGLQQLCQTALNPG